MTDTTPHTSLPTNVTALGTCYCILSAVFYTLMGICQRSLSDNCDPVWVNCVQASVSTVVFGVYLTFLSLRGSTIGGHSVWPPLKIAIGLMMLGTITQIGGTSYQWSLGKIGLSIGNPLQMGVMLAASAILGFLILREKVSWRAIMAIVLITASIVFLGTGAESVESVDGSEAAVLSQASVADVPVDASSGSAPLWVLLGVGAACLSGVAFAILTVGMRKTATEETSPEAIVFFINGMGILFLGPWAMLRLGIDGMMATSGHDLVVMLATGVCNLMAFLLIAKALQLTTVVRVNVINNAMTTAMTVIAGIAIFAEPCGVKIILGIMFTLVGIVLISYNGSTKEESAESTTVREIEDAPRV